MKFLTGLIFGVICCGAGALFAGYCIQKAHDDFDDIDDMEEERFDSAACGCDKCSECDNCNEESEVEF